MPAKSLSRRTLLGLVAAGAATAALRPARAMQSPVLTRAIPSSGEALPLVGLGSWITFNVGDDPQGREDCTAVMRAFFESGGRLIDSSPMYGSSQAVIGDGLRRLGHPPDLFSATKVWISSGDEGPEQIAESQALWDLARFDLLQVHNLLAWEEHLDTLLAMKDEGRLRYVGVTTSHGRRHAELEEIMASRPLDFVQVTYNPVDRAVEERILPLAAERGIAVIANRPFRGGALTEALAAEPLPPLAAALDCASWAQLLLKFTISHPAVTSAIPATTRVDHVRENLDAARGPLPDAAQRAALAALVADL